MAAQRRYKMINFDLSIARLEEEFGQGKYHKGYSLIKRFFEANGFMHHQYSGYLSASAMDYGDVYILVLNNMISKLPWLIDCVEKFDATNVTSQSNMLEAIRGTAKPQTAAVPTLFAGDMDVIL